MEVRRVDGAQEAARQIRAARDCLERGDPAGAEICLREAIEADPHRVEAHELLQDLLRATGREAWCREAYEAWRDRHPQDPAFVYLEARALPPGPDRLARLERLLEERPSFPPALLLMGRDLRRAGAFGRALALTETGAAQEAPRLLYLGAELCLDLGRVREASSRVGRILQRWPSREEAYDLATEIALRWEGAAAVAGLADRARRQIPDRPETALLEALRGGAPDDPQGRGQLGIRLEARVRADPTAFLPRLALARVLRARDPAGAAELLSGGGADERSRRRAAYLLVLHAEALQEKGADPEADWVLDDALRRFPERWEIALARAERWALAGDRERALGEIARYEQSYGAEAIGAGGAELLRSAGGPAPRERGPYLRLRAVLEAHDPGAKLQALRALRPGTHLWSLPLLGRAARDPDDRIRTQAVRLLGAMAPAMLWQGGWDVLGDPSARVRGAALTAVSRLRNPGARQALVRGLEDSDAYVREVAILALERIRGDRLGFDPGGATRAREAAVRRWREWLSGDSPFGR